MRNKSSLVAALSSQEVKPVLNVSCIRNVSNKNVTNPWRSWNHANYAHGDELNL